MTEKNPFEKPVENNPYAAGQATRGPEPMPTGVMVVSIIALMLGALGLFGSCIGGAGTLASESFMSFLPENVQEATKKAMEVQFVPAIIQVISGFVLSSVLLVAGIGCLTRKPWGRNLIRMTMIGCILNSLFSICVIVWMTLAHAETLAAPNEAQGMGREQALQIFYAGQIFTFVLVAGFLAFYIFGVVYFGKQKVIDFFERQAEAAG